MEEPLKLGFSEGDKTGQAMAGDGAKALAAGGSDALCLREGAGIVDVKRTARGDREVLAGEGEEEAKAVVQCGIGSLQAGLAGACLEVENIDGTCSGLAIGGGSGRADGELATLDGERGTETVTHLVWRAGEPRQILASGNAVNHHLTSLIGVAWAIGIRHADHEAISGNGDSGAEAVGRVFVVDDAPELLAGGEVEDKGRTTTALITGGADCQQVAADGEPGTEQRFGIGCGFANDSDEFSGVGIDQEDEPCLGFACDLASRITQGEHTARESGSLRKGWGSDDRAFDLKSRIKALDLLELGSSGQCCQQDKEPNKGFHRGRQRVGQRTLPAAMSTSSTRRFLALPSSVVLVATGEAKETPTGKRRSVEMPLAARFSTTDSARFWERVRL